MYRRYVSPNRAAGLGDTYLRYMSPALRPADGEPGQLSGREEPVGGEVLGLAVVEIGGTGVAQGLLDQRAVVEGLGRLIDADRQAAEKALTYMDLRPGAPMREIPIDAVFVGSDHVECAFLC